jgi:hypothetical protein
MYSEIIMYSEINKDCKKCTYSRRYNEDPEFSGSIIWTCGRKHTQLTSVKAEDKPCKLPKGKYYVCNITLNE